MVSYKVFVALAGLVALTLSGCGAEGPNPRGDGAKDTFKVYASLGVTGPVAGAARANIAGLEAAIETVNSQGGIDGRAVQLVVGDDGLDPARATTLLQEQLDKGQIDLVVPGSTSNVGLALIAALTREGIITTGQQATLADATKYPSHFGMVVPNSTQVQGLVDVVASEGHAKVGVLHSNDANGAAVGAAYRAAFEAKGLAVVEQSYAPSDVDMTAQLQALEAEKPDALVMQGFGPVAGYALKSRSKLGWDVPTFGHADFGSVDLSQISSRDDWNNVRILTYYPLAADTPRTAGYTQLMETLKRKGVKIDQPLSQYAVFWDLIFLAKRAWESTDSNKADDLKAAWLALNEKSTEGSPYIYMPSYRFNPNNHQFDIEPSEAMRMLVPGALIDGVIDSNH